MTQKTAVKKAVAEAVAKAVAEVMADLEDLEEQEPEVPKPRAKQKRNIPREKINMGNLKPRTATDTHGGTVTLTGRFDPEDKEFLTAQPEGASYHLRQAVREYVAKLKKAQAKAARAK